MEKVNNSCICKDNNKSSRDFIIICKINEITPENISDKSEVEKVVEKWLLSKLSDIDHPSIGPYSILVDTVVGEEGIEIVEFAVHMDAGILVPPMDDDGLIYLKETPDPPPTLHSNIILKHLTEIPECVIGIGVSSVSSKFMAETWWEWIDGYVGWMSKYMWTQDLEGTWYQKREMSFNFDWENYPPMKRINK